MTMRILHVLPGLALSSGGPTTALIGLARAQMLRGDSVRVLCTVAHSQTAPSDGAQLCRSLGLSVRELPVRGAFGRTAALQGIVREAVQQSDAVHLHGMWEELLWRASRACVSLGTPYWVRPCGMLDPWSLAQSRWKKRAYLALRGRRMLRDAHAVHFVSDGEAELASALMAPGAALVVPNGVDADAAIPNGRGSYWELRIGSESPGRIILFLGRLHPKKNLEALLHAFRGVPDDGTIMVIAGPLNEYAREVILPLATSDHRVHVVGEVPFADRLDAMAGADLLVLPSLQENFGNVVIEALVMGTPVLLSDAVNLAAPLQRGGHAQVCRTSMESLRVALGDFMSAPTASGEVRRRHAEFARSNYSWPVIAEQWASLYQEGISRCRNGR